LTGPTNTEVVKLPSGLRYVADVRVRRSGTSTAPGCAPVALPAASAASPRISAESTKELTTASDNATPS
jgi:hypothetical protein